MQPIVQLYQHPNPLFVEAFDDIIVELTAKGQEGVAQILAFCGSDPGVGTTTVAINLAISLAHPQWKTLLVDGDMRKQRAHKHLSSGERAGLSDYLQNLAKIPEVVCSTNHPNLDYLPCGSEIAHPLRLMGSRNFRTLMEKLSPRYNFILIDSPSIAAANDIFAISNVADKVFVVAEPNRSTKENLGNIKLALGEDTHKMGGVIVNKVADRDYRGYRMNYDYFDKEQYLTRKNKQKLEQQVRAQHRVAYVKQLRVQDVPLTDDEGDDL